MAAAEFLMEYLKFDHKDMNAMVITDTRKSGKGDNILYVVMDSPRKIKDIRRRRYTALGRYARQKRQEDPSLKTQIRFNDHDIGLFTK